MDVNKNTLLPNIPWILCPSKSFPGKFYYFNVQSGEAVWSLKSKENIRLKASKSDTYREATTPPINSPANTSANILPNPLQENVTSLEKRFSQNTPIFGQQPPIYGQLGNLTANLQQFIPNIFWTPMQIPILTYISSDSVRSLPEPIFERVIETPQMDKKVIVHSSGVPLSHRFINYEILTYNKEKKNRNFFPSSLQHPNSGIRQFEDQILNSNPESSEIILNEESVPVMSARSNLPDNFEPEDSERQVPAYSGSFVNMETESAMNDVVSQTSEVGTNNFGMEISKNEIPKYIIAENTKSFSNMECESLQNSFYEETFDGHINSSNKEKTSKSSYDHNGNGMLSSYDHDENGMQSYYYYDKNGMLNSYDHDRNGMLNNPEHENNLKHLKSTDLRFHLLAKRRKLEADGVFGYVENKKPKLQEKIQKKKVTFNLDNLHDDTDKTERIVRTFSPIDNDEDYNIKFIRNDGCTNLHKRSTLTGNTHNIISVAEKASMIINNTPIYTIKSHSTEKENAVRIKNHKNLTGRSATEEFGNIPNKNSTNDFKQIVDNNSNFIDKKDTTNRFAYPNYIPFVNGINNHSITIYNTPKMNENNCNPTDRTKYIADNMRSQAYETKITLHNVQTYKNTTDDLLNNDNNIANKNSAKNIIKTDGMPLKFVDDAIVTRNDVMASKMSISYTYKDVWYLVVDLDVLLDDHLLVDKLVQSDDKCRLLVPQAIRNELEALCIGDCRGRQRVLIARHISRRIDGLDERIIVERTLNNENFEANTTDLILKCCLNVFRDNYYVVLLTNDGYLKNKANSLNIRCYTPEEVKKGAIIAPKLFAELKKIKLTIDNTINKNNSFEQNKKLNSISKNNTGNTVNKEFIGSEQTDANCDNNNITKSKSDSQRISRNLNQLDLTDKVNRLNLKDSETQSKTKFSKDMSIQKQISNKTIQIDRFEKATNSKDQNSIAFIENSLDKKSHNSAKNKNCTLTLMNVSESENNSNNINDNKLIIQQNVSVIDKVTKELSQINDVDNDVISISSTSTIKSSILISRNVLTNFKIPKLMPNKNVTIATSEPVNVLDAIDDVRSNFKNSEFNFERCLEKFTVKDNQMYLMIKARMDELICCYTQIMEELLGDIIQRNSDYYNNTNLSAANIPELLSKVKMVYEDNKMKHIIDVLIKLLVKNSCNKGKIKLDTDPKEFLQIVGYGVLLVESLKVIIPDSIVVSECEVSFECLLRNIKNENLDFDVDLLRPAVLCRSEVVDKNECRQNFAKDKSHIIEYLKKHFKEWSEVDNIEQHSLMEKVNVLRMEGKNINKIKIDKNKSVSYIQTPKDNTKSKDGTKKIKLLENNLILKNNSINKQTSNENDGSILRKFITNSQNISATNSINIERIHHIKSVENAKSKEINMSDISEDFPINGNTFNQNNDTTGPRVILNLNSLSDFKEKNKNKGPLNTNVLDNSDNDFKNYNCSVKKQEHNIISKDKETIIAEKDDDISDKSIIIEITRKRKSLKENVVTKKIVNEDDKFKCDYSDSINIKDIYGSRKNNIHCQNGNYATGDRSNGNYVTNERNNENYVADGRNNGNYVRKSDNNGDNENGINDFEMYINGCEKISDNCDDFEVNDNYVGCNDKYGDKSYAKLQLTPKDDSTIDSGFENESTQAHTLVKIFLRELGVTFKVIYNFIGDFTSEIRKQCICQDRKNIIHNKANRCLETMVALTQELESIIQRESNDDTMLKNLFVRAGLEAANDKRITRYRQIIMKCLEQAQILESSLRIIVCITIGDFNAIPYNSNSICTNMRYFNIFE